MTLNDLWDSSLMGSQKTGFNNLLYHYVRIYHKSYHLAVERIYTWLKIGILTLSSLLLPLPRYRTLDMSESEQFYDLVCKYIQCPTQPHLFEST